MPDDTTEGGTHVFEPHVAIRRPVTGAADTRTEAADPIPDVRLCRAGKPPRLPPDVTCAVSGHRPPPGALNRVEHVHQCGAHPTRNGDPCHRSHGVLPLAHEMP
jgi:hypothetical protein